MSPPPPSSARGLIVAGHKRARTGSQHRAAPWVWLPNTSKSYESSEGLLRSRTMSVRVARSPSVLGRRSTWKGCAADFVLKEFSEASNNPSLTRAVSGAWSVCDHPSRRACVGRVALVAEHAGQEVLEEQPLH